MSLEISLPLPIGFLSRMREYIYEKFKAVFLTEIKILKNTSALSDGDLSAILRGIPTAVSVDDLYKYLRLSPESYVFKTRGYTHALVLRLDVLCMDSPDIYHVSDVDIVSGHMQLMKDEYYDDDEKNYGYFEYTHADSSGYFKHSAGLLSDAIPIIRLRRGQAINLIAIGTPACGKDSGAFTSTSQCDLNYKPDYSFYDRPPSNEEEMEWIGNPPKLLLETSSVYSPLQIFELTLESLRDTEVDMKNIEVAYKVLDEHSI